MIVILEDNPAKVALILARQEQVITTFITAYQSEAESIVCTLTNPFIVYIDYELPPGAGNGKDFLEYLIQYHKKFVAKAYITTKNPRASAEMYKMCQELGIPVEMMK